MSKLVSVNVGLPRDVAWNGRSVRTAIFKSPVEGRVFVRRSNIEGDGQAYLEGHGGEYRAVMVYQAESYHYWSMYLNEPKHEPSYFGESLTVEEMSDDVVCIGDRYRIGSAVFEVTQPRVTCYKVGLRTGRPNMAALLVDHGRPGFYMRVLSEGEIGAGDEILKVGGGPIQCQSLR